MFMNYLSHQVDYLFEMICIKYPTLLDEIRDRRFTVSNTGFTSRNINTLDELGLLPQTRENEKGWRKFNLNDLLYLYVIEQCKRFNMDSSMLKDIQNLFYANKVNYANGIGEVSATEEALVVMLTESVPMGIKLFADGQAVISDNTGLNFNSGNTKPAVYIDLNMIFQSQIEAFKSRKQFKDKYDLSEFEDGYLLKPIKPENARLVKIIQGQEYTKVTITKKPNGKIEVSGEKIAHAPKLTAEDIQDLMGNLGNGKVELSVKDGVSQHLTVKRSHKI